MVFSFWTFSIGGGALLFLYALVRRDPVYILGQGMSLLIYFRNVSFVLRERREAAAAAHPDTGQGLPKGQP